MMKLTTIAYGIGIVIISTLIHYATQSGIDNCNSMAGIVSTYTSQDYSTGCHTLSIIQIGSLVTVLAGTGIVISGIIIKQKIK